MDVNRKRDNERRKAPANRWGCKPSHGQCLEHDEPLRCKHGCTKSREHDCKQLDEAKKGTNAIPSHSEIPA
jgi:hypothetical protein